MDEDVEFKLPEMDWENLEAKLKLAHQEVTKQVLILFIKFTTKD